MISYHAKTGDHRLPWWSSDWDSRLPLQQVQVWSLVEELRPHMPCCQEKKNKKPTHAWWPAILHLFWGWNRGIRLTLQHSGYRFEKGKLFWWHTPLNTEKGPQGRVWNLLERFEKKMNFHPTCFKAALSTCRKERVASQCRWPRLSAVRDHPQKGGRRLSSQWRLNFTPAF